MIVSLFRLQPKPHLDIRIDMKSPGLDDKVETATLTHWYSEDAVDGYVKLFYDALRGDQSHFVHTRRGPGVMEDRRGPPVCW